MDKITELLYLSDIEQAGQPESYGRHGISEVVKLTYNTPDDGYPDSVAVHEFSMMDGPRNDPEVMAEAAEMTASIMENGDAVLVHCSMGTSRSVGVAAAALAVYNDIKSEEGLNTLREHTHINIHDAVRTNAEDAVETLKEQSRDVS